MNGHKWTKWTKYLVYFFDIFIHVHIDVVLEINLGFGGVVGAKKISPKNLSFKV
jgi:hypothetical protein